MCVMVNGHTLDERGGPEKGRRGGGVSTNLRIGLLFGGEGFIIIVLSSRLRQEVLEDLVIA